MKLENLLPKDGPSINEVNKYIEKYKNDLIVVKCGGSCLIDKNLFDQLIEDISIINKLGLKVVVVHGGGKKIQYGGGIDEGLADIFYKFIKEALYEEEEPNIAFFEGDEDKIEKNFGMFRINNFYQ